MFESLPAWSKLLYSMLTYSRWSICAGAQLTYTIDQSILLSGSFLSEYTEIASEDIHGPALFVKSLQLQEEVGNDQYTAWSSLKGLSDSC